MDGDPTCGSAPPTESNGTITGGGASAGWSSAAAWLAAKRKGLLGGAAPAPGKP